MRINFHDNSTIQQKVGESPNYAIIHYHLCFTEIQTRLTDQDGAGNFLIQRGRKVGFDRHFNAWGNACICLTSGIPRLEYQQAYDGTKDFWGTTAQYGMSGFPLNAPDNNPVEGIYSHRLPSGVEIENDLQPFLNKAYLGADAPAIVYDGAHFSFKDLHTPLNKGNLNTLAGNTLDSGDEDQVVYKINPQQSYNNLTPTHLHMINFTIQIL